MSEPLIHDIAEILISAFCILLFQITFIILGSRFGWFLWIIKKFLEFRRKREHKKKRKSPVQPQEE
ncbi:hypothetical protein [Caldalkalibacillus mannanilyticus]|uniref:hypothetical protein n=1 Tax=Caldalkalibacillus mannanilyticus TaxID=1418 RepID=UPI00046ABAA6|nr:hypothetical protein [Caldalkalibacillus mannanilyticus]